MLRMQNPFQPHYSLYVYLRTNTLKLMVLLRTSADGQPPPPDARTSHLRTLSKIPGFGLSASPIPSAPKCPREPHIIQGLYGSSTPCSRGFFLPSGPAERPASGEGAHLAASPRACEVLTP